MNQHPFFRLLAYARSYRRRISIAAMFSILNKLFDLAPPALIGVAVNVVVEREESFIAGLGFENVSDQLWVLAGITLFIWIMESLFEFGHRVYWRNLAQDMQHDMRVETYNHVQNLEMAYYEDRSTGGLMSVLNDDVNQLERFLDVGANDIIQVTTTVIAVTMLFFIAAPQVAWMALIPIPIIIYGSMWFQKRLTPR